MERHVEAPSAYEYPAPTDEETMTLRKVAGRIPKTAYLICIVQLVERAAYWGAIAVYNNYMQFPLPKGGNGTGAVPKSNPNGHAGALNKGLQFATAMSVFFGIFYYTVPVFGAWLADAKIGRFKGIVWGVLIGAVGHIIMVGGAAPDLLKAGKGLAPFMVSYTLLSIGAGIFKPLIVPMLLDQYEHQKPYTKALKSGEKVVVDPEITMQRILIIFYGFANIGAFYAIATTYAEKYAGFWVAFLLTAIMYLFIPPLLILMNKRWIKKPAVGSEMVEFFKIIAAAIKGNKWKLWGRGYWNAARPAALAAKGRTVTWTDKSVADVYRTVEACQVFLYFPLHGTTVSAASAIGSFQAAAMTSGGVPNDLMANLNPMAILIFTPILSYGLYPLLRRRDIRFGRIDRIAFGFIMAAISAAVGAIVQWRVYETSPCSYYASSCSEVSPISIWWQLPNICLGAISEMFVNVTGYELAYARAPPNMKSFVMAIFLFSNAVFITLASVIIPLIQDPYLIWIWASLAIALGVETVIFVWRHRHMNDDEFMLYENERPETAPSPITENK